MKFASPPPDDGRVTKRDLDLCIRGYLTARRELDEELCRLELKAVVETGTRLLGQGGRICDEDVEARRQRIAAERSPPLDPVPPA